MNKGITLKTGQTHVQRYLKPLLEMIEHMIRSRFAREGVRGLFDVRGTPEAVMARLDELEQSPAIRPPLESLVPAGAKR